MTKRKQNIENQSQELLNEVIKGEADLKEVERLIQQKADVNTKDEAGWNLLHHAVAKNNLALVKLLIEKSADKNAQTLEDGLTALHLAAMNGYTAVVEFLISSGVNRTLETKRGNTAYTLAKIDGYEDIQLLIDRKSPKSKEDYKEKTLHEVSFRPLPSQSPPSVSLPSQPKPDVPLPFSDLSNEQTRPEKKLKQEQPEKSSQPKTTIDAPEIISSPSVSTHQKPS